MNGVKRVYFSEIESTNEYAKTQRAFGRDLLVIAEKQSGGRGTKGRSFSSCEGGVYLSALSFYQNFPASDAFVIMQSATTAVCETLVKFGLQPVIKWPNDVFVNGKKICGILIENALSGREIASSVVGIGLNVCNPLPEELTSVATTIFLETGKAVSVEEVRETLIALLYRKGTAKEYANYLGWLGEEVKIIVDEKEKTARLLSVDERGNLWAEVDGKKQPFASAEISLRVGENAIEEDKKR